MLDESLIFNDDGFGGTLFDSLNETGISSCFEFGCPIIKMNEAISIIVKNGVVGVTKATCDTLFGNYLYDHTTSITKKGHHD